MAKVELPNGLETKFVLMGSGYNICSLAKMLIEKGFPKPVILTHPKEDHLRDIGLYGDSEIYQNIFNVAEDLDLELIERKTVNKPEVIERLKELGCNAAFSLSCRSIIKKEFIDAFKGNVFNIHPSMLPKEKGGGVFSWRIMNGVNLIAATIHYIDEGVDTGDIILQEGYESENSNMNVYSMLSESHGLFDKLLEKFLTDKDLESRKQNPEEGTYLPRLYTEKNGALDWKWSAKEVISFINAFSFPYPGAFTYINGDENRCIHILEAELNEKDSSYHSFMCGRMNKVYNDGSANILTSRGSIRVLKVRERGSEEIKTPASLMRETDLLNTPIEIIEESQRCIPKVKDMKAKN